MAQGVLLTMPTEVMSEYVKNPWGGGTWLRGTAYVSGSVVDKQKESVASSVSFRAAKGKLCLTAKAQSGKKEDMLQD